ncbi:MAG: glycerol-3-phosphate 1-O-acyltransferase PlsY [Planctomycetota bacterium]
MPTTALLATAPEWIALLASYLLGAVPFGLVLGYLVRGVDIRTAGSGNIGATNAGRVLGRPWAIVAFALDFAKGWAPAGLLAPWLSPPERPGLALAVLCGAAAVGGHVWPVYLRFRGGKGVATGCGVILALDPIVFLGGGLAWLATLALTRFVGLSSMVMGAAFPLIAAWRMGGSRYGLEVVLGGAALAVLVLVRHRANIRRMLRGTEPRIGAPHRAKETP